MNLTNMQNISAEIFGRAKAKKRQRSITVPQRVREARPYERYPTRAKHRGVAEALLNTPAPPCTNHDNGPCAFLARCTLSGEVCKAFAAYANLRPFKNGPRIPYRSLRSLNRESSYLDITD